MDASDLNDSVVFLSARGEPEFEESYKQAQSHAKVIHQARVKRLTEPQPNPTPLVTNPDRKTPGFSLQP